MYTHSDGRRRMEMTELQAICGHNDCQRIPSQKLLTKDNFLDFSTRLFTIRSSPHPDHSVYGREVDEVDEVHEVDEAHEVDGVLDEVASSTSITQIIHKTTCIDSCRSDLDKIQPSVKPAVAFVAEIDDRHSFVGTGLVIRVAGWP